MKRRILALVLAMCLLTVCVNAAGPTAKTVAQAYRGVLDSAKLRDSHSVRFYDVCGDAAPEMLLLTQGNSGEQLQIWTYDNGAAALALAVDWVEVSASKHWFYLLRNGDFAWYYTNGGYDHPIWYGTNQGATYARNGASLRQTQMFTYDYTATADRVTPVGGSLNAQTIGADTALQLDRAMTASFSLLLMSNDSAGVPGAMSKSEARTWLSGVTGQFFDVPSGQYYSDAVAWALKNGVTSGTSERMFSPDRPCTRAQAVTFLWRAAGQPKAGIMAGFSDVPAGQYYSEAVAWAVATGVTSGTSPGRFSPDAPCTRAQIVTFLYRAAGAPAVSPSGRFYDVPTGAYYELPVSWAVANGITTGTSDNRFSPASPCTRGQIVTFLYRARDLKLDPQPVKGWREAYRAFVEEQQFLNAGQEYSFAAGFFLVSLYDMDRDGTPELLIQNGAAGRVMRWSYLYTCVSGKVQYLSQGPAEPYYDPGGTAGLYARFPVSPEENWEKYTKSGMVVTRTDAGTFPLFSGHPELSPLPASRDDAIRAGGWDAFLADQPVG